MFPSGLRAYLYSALETGPGAQNWPRLWQVVYRSAAGHAAAY